MILPLDEPKLRAVPSGGVLCTLASGIVIVRRRKHEAVSGLTARTQKEIALLTDMNNGSKFLEEISLRRMVEITAEILEEAGVKPGFHGKCWKVYNRPIGISCGKSVRGVVVDVSSRGAHAYPEDERKLSKT